MASALCELSNLNQLQVVMIREIAFHAFMQNGIQVCSHSVISPHTTHDAGEQIVTSSERNRNRVLFNGSRQVEYFILAS